MSGALAEAAKGQEPVGGRDHLSQRDFARLAEFIQRYSGIRMPSSKATMVEGRLRRRLQATGIPSLKDYCRYLFEDGGLELETVHLIDAVTTNKTEFYREPKHFDILNEKVLPEIADSRRITNKEPLKIWSAACSTGAEPYTLAMVASEFAQGLFGLHTSIIATDLCTSVLETGITGIYPTTAISPVPRSARQRYLMYARDMSRDLVRIVPELRSIVKYGRLNLMDETYAVDDDMDIIFCRNILIYFDKPTQEKVLARLCAHLRPGGYLFLGHSESLAGSQLPVKPIGHAAFRRI